MTGYGRGQGQAQGKQFNVEMKSVNHRFLEISIRLPRQFNLFEERIKELIKEKVDRGRVDVYLNVEDIEESNKVVKVDKGLAIAYYDSLRELSETLQISLDISLFEISQLPNVFSIEEQELDPELCWEGAATATRDAVDDLVKMREVEGRQLASSLAECRERLITIADSVGQRSSDLVKIYREKLQERLEILLKEIPIDEQRVAMEIAIMAEKSDITEELTRFNSHLNQLLQSLVSDQAVGRKLDFLLQELNREVNTIGSKSHDLEISQKVVELKSELEKIREQVQNLE
ncbi:MAG: YicC/YloC family endoribonuclease [Bacillota bacterium]